MHKHLIFSCLFVVVFVFFNRRALRRGESVKYLLPDSVIEYVREHELYGVPDK